MGILGGEPADAQVSVLEIDLHPGGLFRQRELQLQFIGTGILPLERQRVDAPAGPVAAEEEIASIGRPAQGAVVGVQAGDVHRLATLCRHDPDVHSPALTAARVGQPLHVRREGGLVVVGLPGASARDRHQAGGWSSAYRHGVEATVVAAGHPEGDLLPIGSHLGAVGIAGALPEGLHRSRLHLQFVEAQAARPVGGEDQLLAVVRPPEVTVVAGVVGEAGGMVGVALLRLLGGDAPHLAADLEGNRLAVRRDFGLGDAAVEHLTPEGALLLVGRGADRQPHRLARSRPQQPDAIAMLEGDVATAARHRRPTHRATHKAGDLLAFARQGVAPQVGGTALVVHDLRQRFAQPANTGGHLRRADADERLAIRQEARPQVLAARRGEAAPLAALQLDGPHLGRRRSGIAGPGPGEPMPVVEHRLAIRGEGAVADATVVAEKRLEAERPHIGGEQRWVHPIAPAVEDEVLAVGRPVPGHLPPAAVGDAPRRAADCRDDVDVGVAGAVRGEGNPLAIRREERHVVVLHVVGQAIGTNEGRRTLRLDGADGSHPHVAPVDERQRVPVGTEGRPARPDDRLLDRLLQLREARANTKETEEEVGCTLHD